MSDTHAMVRDTMFNNTFAVRTQQLEKARTQLKSDHVGIDDAIDALIDAVAAWFQFPVLQQRPRVLGLWGMTGTGKSSLVKGLVKALAVEDRTFWLDAGQNGDRSWLDEPLSRVGERMDGEPFVLVVDEFQHARTITNGQEAPESTPLRAFWELIDSGRFLTWPRSYHLSDLLDLRDQLSAAIAQGVRVREGKVVRGVNVHAQCLGLDEPSAKLRSDRPWFVPDKEVERMQQGYNDRVRSRQEVRAVFAHCNGPESLQVLNDWIAQSYRMREVDGSKAMVIVLGNLDDLYVMGKVLWPELHPDVLLHRHRKLSANGVPAMLTRMFRVEQVGRLGYDHVLFPPLGEEATLRLVQSRIDRLSGSMGNNLGASIRFSEEACAVIAHNAAVPVLGARPLITAVDRIVPALVCEALARSGQQDGRSISLHITAASGQFIVLSSTDEGSSQVLRSPFPKVPAMDPEHVLRIAVHEAGHVVAGVCLSGARPLQACVRSTGGEVAGFVVWDDRSHEPFLREDVIGRLALALGGYAAERLRYGADGISLGSSDDLRKATRMALGLIREEGFGASPCYQTEHLGDADIGFRGMMEEREREARSWLEEALKRAGSILERERELFARLVDRLSTERSLIATELNAIIEEHRTTSRDQVNEQQKEDFTRCSPKDGMRSGRRASESHQAASLSASARSRTSAS